MKKIIISALLCAAVASVSAADNAPLWLRNAKISPDGNSIAFTYKGDIYTVPVAGGTARQLTSNKGYETCPIWSPDSRRIAFAADINGNFDVFSIAADGSDSNWKRHTFNSADETPEAFTPDGSAIYFSAAIQDPASSSAYPTRRLTELYSVPVAGVAQPVQVLATPARNISWAPDGKSFLYEDVKGFEDTFRKHHTSSVTRDIWRYNTVDGTHTKVVDVPGEDLSPVDAGDEIFFISERAPLKSLNVYRAPATDPAQARPVTNLAKHPVRSLSRAQNGMLAFSYDGELYTLQPGAQPQKVRVAINADYMDTPEDVVSTRGAESAVPSPNGKNIAFIYRGDVFVTSVEYPTTKRITNTPQAEDQVVWANDSTLYYTSEQDGKYNIYSASARRPGNESDLVHATVIDQIRVFDNDGHERTTPRISPDGKKLAFILDRTKLAVMDLETRKVKMLTDGQTWFHRNGAFYYRWSPDSKWIALEIIDRKHDPYTDVAIINVENGRLTNITNSGYFDAEPIWVLGGNALAFASERYGMRNHASWGSQMDVMFAFMNEDAYNRFRMSKEERELAPKAPKDSMWVELDNISERQLRVTPMSTELISAMVDPSGDALYFTSRADDGSFLWKYDFDEEDLDMVKRVPGSPYFEISDDGKTMFVFGRSLNKFTGSALKPVSYRAEMRVDAPAEREYMFDNMVREEAERFYVKDMHGVDWKKLSAEYRRFLPHINNNYDFAYMLSELLGELNVSHTGARYTGGPDSKLNDNTAALGALYDLSYAGPGLRIAEVLPRGPLAALAPAVKPGDVILAIDGVTLTPEQNADIILNGKAGKRTLVDIRCADGSERHEVVKPISAGRQNALLATRWEKNREHLVDSLSNGRLGYVHISSMDDDSFRKAYSKLLGKFNDREGVVIDIRWNGGGRLHEDIEVLLSGQKYFTQEIRGTETCDMPSRRWNKPSIMVMSEACYSNAHGTPWVYTHRGLGKTVGMPVPGTMTSVNWVTMQDPSVYYGIPVVGYRLADGSFLENQQLNPDFMVENLPGDVAKGEDAQIKAAVVELLKQIDGR